MDMTAKVKSISPMRDKNMKEYWLIWIEGEDKDTCISSWNFDPTGSVEKGKEYTFPVEVKGRFINLMGTPVPCQGEEGTVAKYKAELEKEVEKESRVQMRPVPKRKVDNNPFITRMSALKSAIEYFGQNPNPLLEEKEILTTARIFEEYINEG